MRRYTVKTADFGNMPIAGYITEIMKKVVDFDGWNILSFAQELDKNASELDENGSGELFILLHADDFSDKYGQLDYDFFINEQGLDSAIEQSNSKDTNSSTLRNTMILRLFGHDEEFGLEELMVLF